MDGNSAKKVPLLDGLVDTPAGATKTPTPLPQAQTMQPALTTTNGKAQINVKKSAAAPLIQDPPKNRHTDKSKFEIELTLIVNQIMTKHFRKASEQIVQEVLREVRARLPGQRKD